MSSPSDEQARSASLADVLAHPHDTARRLEYALVADALGDRERAEFIRLQVAASIRARDGIHHPDLGRQLSLQHRHGAEWAGELGKLVNAYGFYRGFVEYVALDADAFLERATSLYGLAPIRFLELSRVETVVDRLFASPHLQRIVGLSLRGPLDDGVMRTLAGSRQMWRLAWLSIDGSGVTAAGREALVASPNLTVLRELRDGGGKASISEDLGYDQGALVDVKSPLLAQQLEAKYGRKRWLHTVEEHGEPLSFDQL